MLRKSDRVASVLIADDSPEGRWELLQEVVEQYFLKTSWSFSYRIVRTADNAWEILQKNHFDLAFVDIEMAGRNNGGIGLIQEIRRQEKKTGRKPALIICITDAPETKRVEAIKAGANAIILKPDVVSKIMDLLGIRFKN